jgi:hypothetical protein
VKISRLENCARLDTSGIDFGCHDSHTRTRCHQRKQTPAGNLIQSEEVEGAKNSASTERVAIGQGIACKPDSIPADKGFVGKCCNFDGVLEIGPMTTPTSHS